MAAGLGAVHYKRVDAGGFGLLRVLDRGDDVQPPGADGMKARHLLARPALRGDHHWNAMLERDVEQLLRPGPVQRDVDPEWLLRSFLNLHKNLLEIFRP